MKTLKQIYLEALNEQPPPMMHYRWTGGIKPPLPPNATPAQKAWDVMTTEYSWEDIGRQLAYLVKTQPVKAWQWLRSLAQQIPPSEFQRIQQIMAKHGIQQQQPGFFQRMMTPQDPAMKQTVVIPPKKY